MDQKEGWQGQNQYCPFQLLGCDGHCNKTPKWYIGLIFISRYIGPTFEKFREGPPDDQPALPRKLTQLKESLLRLLTGEITDHAQLNKNFFTLGVTDMHEEGRNSRSCHYGVSWGGRILLQLLQQDSSNRQGHFQKTSVM